jgi:pilus assembly protein Flp/PilA
MYFAGATDMTSLAQKFAKDESGATAIEYGLIAALIAVVCITMWRNIGSELLTKFTAVRNGLK